MKWKILTVLCVLYIIGISPVLAEDDNEYKEEVNQAFGEVNDRINELPAWIRNIAIKGDFRLREQLDQNESSIDRWRTRIRLRVGAAAKVSDDLKVNFGVASGGLDTTNKGADPRSTNQTLENTFQKGILFIDYADFEYTTGIFKFMGGVIPFSSFLWMPSDLLWDTDITWHGLGMKVDEGSLYTYAGVLVLDEISANLSDPMLCVVQEGLSVKEGQLGFNLAAAYYAFSGLTGYRLDWSSGTNTISANPKNLIAYNYNSVGLGFDLGVSGTFLPSITLFGEGVCCIQTTQTGFLGGLKFGAAKVSDAGQWQVQLSHRRLMKDAWVDAFADSDAYGGKTNAFVHEVIVNYGLGTGRTLSLDYYFGQKLDSSSALQHILQIDFVCGF